MGGLAKQEGFLIPLRLLLTLGVQPVSGPAVIPLFLL